jgi:dihydropteroate synthase
MNWLCAGRDRLVPGRPLVMGILNVTPDSFSDGGRFSAPEAAIEQGLALAEEGADLIDLGAESTRPGAVSVPAAEQVRRLAPVLEGLSGLTLSVDTASAEVAAYALAHGAVVVNDVTALSDPAMARVVAEAGAGLVLMHMRGTPRTMQQDLRYDDVVGEVERYLRERLAAAVAAGIPADRVALDPGIGFGKSGEHSVALLAATARLAAIGRPLLVGASRKSFLGRLTGAEDPRDRLEASLAAATLAAHLGAGILRVHDVAATMRAVQVVAAVRAAGMATGTRNG